MSESLIRTFKTLIRTKESLIRTFKSLIRMSETLFRKFESLIRMFKCLIQTSECRFQTNRKRLQTFKTWFRAPWKNSWSIENWFREDVKCFWEVIYLLGLMQNSISSSRTIVWKRSTKFPGVPNQIYQTPKRVFWKPQNRLFGASFRNLKYDSAERKIFNGQWTTDNGQLSTVRCPLFVDLKPRKRLSYWRNL